MSKWLNSTQVAFPIFIFLISLLPWIFLTNRLFLVYPLPVQDEAVIFDVSNTVLTKGKLATSVYGPANSSFETHFNLYPPLYHFVLAGWMGLFGTTIESVRSLSAVIGFFALLALFFLIRNVTKSILLAGIGVLLISIDPAFQSASHIGRMEILTFLFIIGSLMLFQITDERKYPFIYISAGVAATFAILSHPMGLIAPSVLTVWILMRHMSAKTKIATLAMVLVPVAIGLGFWFLSVIGRFDEFMTQYWLQLEFKKTVPSILLKVLEGSIPSLIQFIAVGLSAIILLFWRRFHVYGIFIIGLCISTALVFLGKDLWYLVYQEPFAVIMPLLVVHEAWHQHKQVFFYLGCILLVFIGGTFGFTNWKILVSGSVSQNYHTFSQRIAELIPAHSSVLISSVPDPYIDLYSYRKFTLYQYPVIHESPSLIETFEKADYVVVSLVYPPLAEYLRTHTFDTLAVRSPGGYEALVIRLAHDGPKN